MRTGLMWLALALAACAPTAGGEAVTTPSASLAGTSWQLVEFRSMDDAQRVRRPADPTRYRLDFGADGRISAQLDCNRGMGPWKAEAAGTKGGTLQIGPIAMTRMACPQGSMDSFVAARISEVRIYVVKGGHLHMNLAADGGDLVWEPAVPLRSDNAPR